MRLWRISDFVDLSGQGGLLAPARWHSRQRPIVYLADHPASALLEVLVHLEVDADELPDAFQLLAVDAPDDLAFERLDRARLPEGWPQDFSVTGSKGDGWLDAARSPLMQVPSAIVPAAFNWLLNPVHPDAARIVIADVVRAPFDRRLFRGVRSAETPPARPRAPRARGRSPRPSGGRGPRRKRRPSPA